MEELLFQDLKNWLYEDKRNSEWTTIYQDVAKTTTRRIVYAIMLPENLTEKFLAHHSWSLNSTQFKSGYAHYSEGTPIYYRWGIESSYEPLVYQMFFNNIYKTRIELIEEFKLFFNLYHDKESGEYISVNISSEENTVVKIIANEILVKTDCLREFLFAKRMVLGIQIDEIRHSSMDPEKLYRDSEYQLTGKSKEHIFDISFQKNYLTDNSDMEYNSKFQGKCILRGFKDQNIQTDYERLNDDEYCSYIVDKNLDTGDVIYESCNKSELDLKIDKYNYFTPVFFSRNVLSKYFANLKLYLIEDGELTMKGSWSLEMDNNHSDCIVVYLGDLRAIPYLEQLYWKSHNIKPKAGISHIKFRRDFLNQYSEPKIVDLKFKKLYKLLNEKWEENQGFPLFSKLNENDQHCYESIRIPLTKEQAELDSLILNLSKILIDYLNVQEINKRIPAEESSSSSLVKLKVYFDLIKVSNSDKTIQFFKKLQKLRSTGSAHRKSKDYLKAQMQMAIKNKNEIESFIIILKEANMILEHLIIFTKEA